MATSAKKNGGKKRNFKLDEQYGGSLVEARRQEMEQILPGFYTNVNGVIINSKPITNFKAN